MVLPNKVNPDTGGCIEAIVSPDALDDVKVTPPEAGLKTEAVLPEAVPEMAAPVEAAPVSHNYGMILGFFAAAALFAVGAWMSFRKGRSER